MDLGNAGRGVVPTQKSPTVASGEGLPREDN